MGTFFDIRKRLGNLISLLPTTGGYRFPYDSSNYGDLIVYSDGHTEIATTGTDADITLDSANGIFLEVGDDFQATLQDSTYLYATAAIKEAERGIVSLYCESLGSAINTDAADRTAFLIRTRMGSDAASVTTGRNAHALDVLMDVNADYAVTTNLRNADARGARIQVYGHESVSGMCEGAFINCQLKAAAGDTAGTERLFDGRLMESISFAGGVGLEIRYETQYQDVEGSAADVVAIGTAGGGASAFIGLIVSYNGRCKLTGNIYHIYLEKPEEGGAVSGETVGIKYGENNIYSTETDFDIGIDLADTCVIGIDIGIATTGIAITGACTDGISVSSASTDAIHISGAISGVGVNFGSAVTGDLIAATDCDQFFVVTATPTGDTAYSAAQLTVNDTLSHTSGTARGLYVNMTHATNAATGGTIRGFAVDVNATANVETLSGIGVYTGSCSGATITNLAGYRIYMDDTPNTITEKYAFDLNMACNTGSATKDAFFRLYNHSGAINKIEGVFWLGNSGAEGAADYFLDFAAGVLPFTTDTVATNAGVSDGCIKVRVAGTAYEIPIFLA